MPGKDLEAKKLFSVICRFTDDRLEIHLILVRHDNLTLLRILQHKYHRQHDCKVAVGTGKIIRHVAGKPSAVRQTLSLEQVAGTTGTAGTRTSKH